ncbi:MAG: hypothetical protein V3T56_07345 [Gemmatimonadales bacterium]
MPSSTSSLAVILSAGGRPLDLQALQDMPLARVIRAEIAEGDNTACVTATVHHQCDRSEFRKRVRAWASDRGWQVTVAPLPEAR